MSKKLIPFIAVFFLLIPLASASCTDFDYENTGENYYPDQDYSGTAHAYAKIQTSRMYGEDCTDNPYKEYAKVRVDCDGYSRVSNGPFYLYRLGPNADWDDAKEEISCNKWGCVGYDEYFSSGTHTITLRDEKGEMDTAFFVCYDYDKSSEGYWAWTWTGMGFYGTRSVYNSHSYKQCSGGDIYWYDSLDRKEDKYQQCGSDKVCQDTKCVCSPQEEKRCYNGDVYWYDSCGNRGNLRERCEADEACSNGSCGKPAGGSVLEFLEDIMQSIFNLR